MSLISDYQTAALARACVAFWPLTETDGTAADATGHGYNGSGGPDSSFAVTGPDGTTLVQGGNNANYIIVPSDTGFPAGASAFSIDLLFALATATETATPVWVNWGTDTVDGEDCYLGASASPGVTHTFRGSGVSSAAPGGTFGGTWHQASLTWDGTTRTLYLDGAQVAQDTPTGVNMTLSGQITIGAPLDGSLTITNGDGLCCVGVYSECLPSGFIASQYARLPTYASAGPTTGTTRSSGTAVGSAGTAAPRTVQIVDVYRNGSATAQVGAYVRARLPTVAPTALYRTTGGVVLRPVSDVEITDSFGNYRLPLIPPGDILPAGQPYIVEFSRKADFSVVDVVVETTSFGYMAGDHPLADVLPTDSIGTRVLVTVDLRDCSGTALVGQLVSVRPLGDSVLTATGALIGSRDAAASTTVDSNARASFLLYPSAALNPAQVYSLTSSATNQVLFFTVPDAGGVVTAHLTEAVAAGFISVTAAEVQSAGTAAVQHTSPTSVQEDVENLRYLQGQAPRGQIGYAAITAPLTTTSTTLTDAAGLTVSVTATARSLKVTAYTGSLGSTGGAAELVLYDVTAAVEVQRALVGSDGGPVSVQAIATPGAGSRSYKVQYRGVSAGTTTLDAGTATPAYLLVEEV